MQEPAKLANHARWYQPDVLSKVHQRAVGKSSLQVSLVLLGASGVSACDNDNVGTRYEYNNRQECVQDWGEDECPTQNSARGGYYGGGYFFYHTGYYDRHKVTHAKSVTRGGFGSKARGGS